MILLKLGTDVKVKRTTVILTNFTVDRWKYKISMYYLGRKTFTVGEPSPPRLKIITIILREHFDNDSISIF